MADKLIDSFGYKDTCRYFNVPSLVFFNFVWSLRFLYIPMNRDANRYDVELVMVNINAKRHEAITYQFEHVEQLQLRNFGTLPTQIIGLHARETTELRRIEVFDVERDLISFTCCNVVVSPVCLEHPT